jgi:hypothetical protein
VAAPTSQILPGNDGGGVFTGQSSYNSGIVSSFYSKIYGGNRDNIFGGRQNKIYGTGTTIGNTIVGGFENKINQHTYSTIIGSYRSEIDFGVGANSLEMITNSSYSYIKSSQHSTIIGSSASTVNTPYNGLIINSTNSYINVPGQISDQHTTLNIIGGQNNLMSGSTISDSTIIGRNNNIFGTDISDVFVIGSNITAVSGNTTHVNNFNIYDTPITDNTIGDLLVRDTDGTVKIREATSLSGTSSGATISGFPVKVGFNVSFTADTAETFVHGMGLTGDEIYDIVVKIRDKDNNEEIAGVIHDFAENQVQITLSQDYPNCRVVIIG